MKLMPFIGGVCAFFLAAHFSSPSSNQGKEKPDVNVYGALIDATGKRIEVENITVNGRIHDIPVYAKPLQDDINPDSNTTRLNLNELCEIRTLSHNSYTYNKREYVEIQVVFNNVAHSTHSFIIDKRRKVFCDNIEGGAEMEITFQALSRLIIKGSKPQIMERRTHNACLQPVVHPQEDSSNVGSLIPEGELEKLNDHSIDALVTRTYQLLEHLEKEIHHMPDESQEQRSLKSSIISIMHNIKESIQSLFS